MPELWLRKIFPKTVFVSTDLPEKRLRVARSQQELDELDDDSTDIYKSNVIEHYSMRPNIIPSVNNMCLAGSPQSSPTFSVRPRSSVGRVTVDLIRRSWVRFPPRSKDVFFTSCGSLIPFTRANAQWVIHGLN